MREHLRRAGEWIRSRLPRSRAPSRALLAASLALLGLDALAWSWPQLLLPAPLLAAEGFALEGPWRPHAHCHKLDLSAAPAAAGLAQPGHPDRSPLLILEDGVPLRRCSSEAELLAQRGRFLHAGAWLYLSSGDGLDPAGNGREYRALVSRELLQREAVACAPAWVFWLSLAGLALLALVWAACWPAVRVGWYCGSLLLALVVFSAQHLRGQWDVFRIARDSSSYLGDSEARSFRPPGYPAFIALVTAGEPPLTVRLAAHPLEQEVRGAEGEPALRVVRSQKLALHAALLLVSALLMWALPPPGVVVCHLLLLHGGWLSAESDWLLSEPLAQAWMLLLVGGFALLARGSSRWLLALPLLAGALLATRLAGVYGVVFPLVGSVLVIRRDRGRAVRPVAAAVALLAACALLPALSRRAQPAAPGVSQWSTTRICFALQLARAGDERLMPDATTRDFLARALARLPLEQAKLEAGRGRVEQWEYLGANLYHVALPVAHEMGLPPGEVEGVFLRAAWPLHRAYPGRLLGLWAESLWTATTRTTRLCSGPGTLLLLVLAAGALGRLCAPWARWVAGTAIGAHAAHLFVVCTCDMPIDRYVYATEPLALLAGCVLVLDAACAHLPGLGLRDPVAGADTPPPPPESNPGRDEGILLPPRGPGR